MGMAVGGACVNSCACGDMMQASLSKLKKSVHQKAIQNRIMEKVYKRKWGGY